MNHIDQSLALLEWAYPKPLFHQRINGAGRITCEAHHEDGRVVPCQTPNLNSLDEIHFLILKLPDDNSPHGLTVFNNKLFTICGSHKACVNATADQRREALLRTLNLWKE